MTTPAEAAAKEQWLIDSDANHSIDDAERKYGLSLLNAALKLAEAQGSKHDGRTLVTADHVQEAIKAAKHFPASIAGEARAEDANVESVIAKHRQRAAVGLKKYGVTTETLTSDAALRHLQEELLDAAVYLEQLLSSHTAQPAAGQWQPISTAPKDGTDFLAHWDDDELHVVCIRDGECFRAMDRKAWMMPSHWQPLPAPPAQPSVVESLDSPRVVQHGDAWCILRQTNGVREYLEDGWQWVETVTAWCRYRSKEAAQNFLDDLAELPTEPGFWERDGMIYMVTVSRRDGKPVLHWPNKDQGGVNSDFDPRRGGWSRAIPASDIEALRRENERLKAENCDLHNRLKIPHPARDMVNECNDALKHKHEALTTAQAEIERLKGELADTRLLKERIKDDPLAAAQNIIDTALSLDPDFARLSNCVRLWREKETAMKAELTQLRARGAELEGKVETAEIAFKIILGWDCLHPEPRADLLNDLPWLKQVCQDAVANITQPTEQQGEGKRAT